MGSLPPKKKKIGFVYPKFQNFYVVKISFFLFCKGFLWQIRDKSQTKLEQNKLEYFSTSRAGFRGLDPIPTRHRVTCKRLFVERPHPPERVHFMGGGGYQRNLLVIWHSVGGIFLPKESFGYFIWQGTFREGGGFFTKEILWLFDRVHSGGRVTQKILRLFYLTVYIAGRGDFFTKEVLWLFYLTG